MLGSLEALLGMFEKIQHDEVGVEVVHKGLGNITEGDIMKGKISRRLSFTDSIR